MAAVFGAMKGPGARGDGAVGQTGEALVLDVTAGVSRRDPQQRGFRSSDTGRRRGNRGLSGRHVEAFGAVLPQEDRTGKAGPVRGVGKPNNRLDGPPGDDGDLDALGSKSCEGGGRLVHHRRVLRVRGDPRQRAVKVKGCQGAGRVARDALGESRGGRRGVCPWFAHVPHCARFVGPAPRSRRKVRDVPDVFRLP